MSRKVIMKLVDFEDLVELFMKKWGMSVETKRVAMAQLDTKRRIRSVVKTTAEVGAIGCVRIGCGGGSI